MAKPLSKRNMANGKPGTAQGAVRKWLKMAGILRNHFSVKNVALVTVVDNTLRVFARQAPIANYTESPANLSTDIICPLVNSELLHFSIHFTYTVEKWTKHHCQC